MRVVPLANDAVNEEWLSDRGRFQYDGLKRQRLGVPMVRKSDGGGLVPSSWEEALGAAAKALADAASSGGAHSVRAVAGKLADVESMVALKDLLARLGSGDCTFEDATASGVDVTARGNYTLSTPGAGAPAPASSSPVGAAALDGAGAILLVGANPRVECAVLNARLRRAWLGGAKIGVVGAAGGGADGDEIDLTYPYSHVGTTADALSALAEGKGEFAAALKEAAASSPGGARIIVGSSVAARREDSAAIVDAAHEPVHVLLAPLDALEPGEHVVGRRLGGRLTRRRPRHPLPLAKIWCPLPPTAPARRPGGAGRPWSARRRGR